MYFPLDADQYGALGINSDGLMVCPPEWPQVCCIGAECQIIAEDECIFAGGEWHIEFSSCDPDPCDLSDVGASMKPISTILYAPSPNPSTGSLTLSYYLEKRERITLAIYDVSGRLIREVYSGISEAGPGSVHWDGRAAGGAPVGQGVYFCRLRIASGVKAERMIRLER